MSLALIWLLSWAAAAGFGAPPSVSISAPALDAEVGGVVSLSGTASGRVVVRLDDGDWKDADGSASWSASIDLSGATDGPHELAARALDADGAWTESSVRVDVFNPRPAVVELGPAQAQILAGDSFSFSAVVRDQRGAVLPDVPVTFASGAPGVASIDDQGSASGAGVGEAEITASVPGAQSASARLVVAGNLVPDADFESEPSAWRLPAEGELDSLEFHSDRQSLKLSSLEAAGAYASPLARIPVVGGSRYRAAAWLRTQELAAGPGRGARVSVGFYDWSGHLVELREVYATRAANLPWTAVSAELHAPAMARTASVFLVLDQASGSVWFDEIELVGAPSSAAPAAAEDLPSDRERVLGVERAAAASVLMSLKVYPNPFVPGGPPPFGAAAANFAGLPPDAEISIYTLAGTPVVTGRRAGSDGVWRWDGRDSGGGLVASGVYVYRARSPQGEARQGRIAVVR